MPLVQISRNPEVLPDHRLKDLLEVLPEIVSRGLHTPEAEDGKLTEDDIEVWVRDSHPLDVNTRPLEIIITSNYFPERAKDLDSRRDYIAQSLRMAVPDELIGKQQSFVWILLCEASFQMI